MNKRRIFLGSFVIITGLTMAGLQIFKYKTSKEIESCLIEQQGYTKKEISEITTHIGKAPLVSTTVIFSDELSPRYFYRKEDGKICQYSKPPRYGIDAEDKIYKHADN